MGKSVYKDVDELPDLNSQEPVYKVDTKTKQVTKYNSVDELPDLKKKVGGNEPSDGGLNGTTSTTNTPTAFDEIRKRDDRTFNQAMSVPVAKDMTYQQKPITPEDIAAEKQRTEAHKKDVITAIDNTTERRLKQKGLTAQKGSALFNAERKKVQEAFDNGDAKFHKYIDKQTGEETIGLDRTIGGWEGLLKGWNQAISGNEEAKAFENMTNRERVEFVKKEKKDQPQPEGYLGEQPGAMGSIGEMVGESGPMLAKAVTGYTAGATLAALALETGGVSLSGLPAVMAYAMSTPDMIRRGMMDETIRRFQLLKSQHPEANEEDLMNQAWQGGSVAGGVTQAATNAVFMGEGLKLPISTESKSVIGGMLKRTMVAGGKMGATTAAGTALQQAEGNLEGIKTSPEDIAKNSLQSFKDNAVYGMLLHGLAELPNLPKAVKSTFKYGIIKDGKLPEVEQTLIQKEQAGEIPQGTTDKVISDLNGYKQALDKTASGLTPESEASVAGLIQAKENIKKEMSEKDESQHAPYKKQIEAIDHQIEEITRTNKPYQSEVDEVTGKPLEKPTFDDVQRERVNDLADKISKGKKIEDIVDVKTEQSFPEEVDKALNRILREEKSRNKDKENPNTEISDNIEKYLSQKEKNAEPIAGETVRETTEAITEPVQQNVGATKEPDIKTSVSESIEPTRQGGAETITTISVEEQKARDIAEVEKPPVDIKFDLKDEDFVKADEPMATKKKYIDLKKEHALLKRIIKDCL